LVDENNIPELAEWHVYGNEQQGRFSLPSPALGRERLYIISVGSKYKKNYNE
jgi:hypothetical protein